MKLTLQFYCILFSFSAFGQIQINGNVKGLGNDTLYVVYMTFSQRINSSGEVYKDTITVKDNVFFYTIDIKEPIILRIESEKILKHNDNRSQQSGMFFLMPTSGEHLDIRGDLDKSYFLSYTVSGSDFNRDFTALRLQNKSKILESDSLQLLLSKPESNKQELMSKLAENTNSQKRIELEYIETYPNTELSVFLLCQQPIDTLGKYMNLLTPEVKEGRFKDLLQQQIKVYQENHEAVMRSGILVGSLAPDFTLKSSQGKDISLYSIEKKFLILDFWGSWCSWCIKEFPKMKELYNNYSSHLEILGIACKDQQQTWLDAIRKYQLNWINVINDSQNDVSVKYMINAYPTKIVLDAKKRIIGIYRGESEAFFEDIEVLIK